MILKIKAFSWLLAGVLLIGSGVFSAQPVEAATVYDINAEDVFLKQQSVDGHCTLLSSAMMLRRYALLRGDADWSSITEETVMPVAWTASGMQHIYSYTTSGGSIDVAYDSLPGGEDNREILISLLEEHPEGVVIYYTGAPHAVLLLDYSNGTFYCADPATSYPLGRIPLRESFEVREDNVTAYWYVSSPAVQIEGPAHMPAEQAPSIRIKAEKLDFFTV